jgi:anti-sigma regulatory factor (Ser/Thr protein kinase)
MEETAMYEMMVEAEMNQLYTVLDCLDELLGENHCTMKVKMKLDIAIEVIFANIVNYAYIPDKGYVTVRCQFNHTDTGKFVKIQFIDSGFPYNPLNNEDPDISLSAERRKIGGLGILMVKRRMDKTEYEYKDGFNILTIQKKLEEIRNAVEGKDSQNQTL